MRSTIRVVAVLALLSSGCEKGKSDEKSNVTANPKVAEGAAKPAPRPATPPQLPKVPVTTASPEARAAFERAMHLLDNMRPADARADLEKAIAADPDFASAHAALGATTPGAPGKAELDRARALSTNLPEAERLTIDMAIAQRDGDTAKADQALDRLVEIAPGDWRVHNQIGGRAMNRQKYDEAIAAFRKALEIAPEAAEAYNGIAYSSAALRKWDEAIEAARKQAVLKPDEPNPQDTYGEILLWANRFDESEAAFRNALSISPQFSLAWQGVGLARAYRKDFKGAHEAFAAGRKASTRPQDRNGFYVDDAWTYLAEGKPAEAAKAIDAFEREAKTAKLPAYAAAPLLRAQLAYVSGKYADAKKQADLAITRLGAADVPGAMRKNAGREALLVKLSAEARLGKAADAAKTLAALEADTTADATIESSRDAIARMLTIARGMAAWAQGGAKAAAEQLTCNADDYICLWQRMVAQKEAHDDAGAVATADQLRSRSYRDAFYGYILTQLPAAKK